MSSVWSAIASLTIAVGAAAAQVPAADTPGAVTLTLEGCLTKEGGADRSTAAEQFILTVAPATPTSPPREQGTRSAGAKAPEPPHPRMFVLRSAPEAPRSFNTMIDHKVRVTGTSTAVATTAPLAGRSPEATPYDAPVATPTPGAATSTPTGTPFDTANLPTIVVHEITSVASSCK
jgi:hypothetical protein